MPFWNSLPWSNMSSSSTCKQMMVHKSVVKIQRNLQLSCIHGTRKFDGGNMKLWWCMAANGAGRLEFVDDSMNASHYCCILDANLIASATALGLELDFVFQQANDPKHMAIIMKRFFVENNINVLDRPSQSPDLSPIEHLCYSGYSWKTIRRMSFQNERPTKGSFADDLVQYWGSATSLLEWMPRRLAAVIKSCGGPTKY